eukprot:m.75212 g.75212  ORF g.75212 m.75212 type:complete len:91 (-) comp11838_c4_seq1:55-327(-)
MQFHFKLGDKGKNVHLKSGTMGGIWKSTKWAIGGGMKSQGSSKTQGGSFVIDEDGSLLYQHIDTGSLDNAPINDLLQAAGLETYPFENSS